MKERNKILVTILVLVIIILSLYTAVLEYRFGILGITGDEKLPLTAKIFTDEKEGLIPLSVNFTTIVQHYQGNLEYSWDFGDGKTSKEINPTHKYEESGEYTCKLVVTDGRSKKSSDSIRIIVKKNKPPVLTLSINQNTLEQKFIPILSAIKLYAGDKQKILNRIEKKRGLNAFGEGSIVCSAQVDDPEDDEIVSYSWVHKTDTQVSQFGKPEQPIHYIQGNNTIKIPEIYTWSTGRHVVTLTVEDSAGNTANASIEFIVDKSLKIINREQKQRWITSTLNKWLVFGKPLVGGIVAGTLLTMWRYNHLTGTKLITISTLTLLLQLDMGDALFIQFREFLNEHPRIKQSVDKRLVAMENRLDKSKLLPSNLVNKIRDSIQLLRENLGLANKRPVISNEVPSDESKHLSTSYPEVAVTVDDPEGDPFNVTIHGKYVNNITLLNQYNNTFVATLITPLPNLTDIYWHVNVSYSDSRWVNATYKFSTW